MVDNKSFSSIRYHAELVGNTSVKYNNYYLALIAVVWSLSMFEHFRGFLTHLPWVGDMWAPYIMPAITVILGWATLRYTRKNFSYIDGLVFFLVVVIFLLNYLIYPQNEIILNKYAFQYLIATFPFYFAGVVFNVEKKTEQVIYWTSVVDLFVLTAYYLLYVQDAAYSGETEIQEDMMGPAYAALPFILFILRKLLIKFDYLSLILSIFGVIFLVSFGARGPVACLLVFIIVYLLFLKKYTKPILYRTVILVAGLLVYANINSILVALISVMDAIGMGTRTIEYAQAVVVMGFQQAADISILERQEMLDESLNYISIWGHGIGSFSRITHSDYSYSHNIIIEFLIEYGWLFGSILLLLILWLFVKCWKITNSDTGKSFVLILFCTGFVSLLFSLTYLIKPEFFFALGYCIHYISINKSLKKRYA